MVFALIFGVALSRVPTEGGRRNLLVRVLDQVFEACMIIVHVVMRLSPVAVFAIVFNTALTFGTGVFASLFLYVLTVTLGLLIQQFGVYTALLWGVARRSPVEFFRNCREVYLYAFSTASSNATLPLSLEVAGTKLRLPPRISRFLSSNTAVYVLCSAQFTYCLNVPLGYPDDPVTGPGTWRRTLAARSPRTL